MYYFNKGVPLDWVSAYMWFSLGAAHGNSLSALFLTEITRKVTKKEITEGQRRTREWITQHGD